MIMPFPKWMNEISISYFLEYLKYGNVRDYNENSIIFQESIMQKLLWIGDYFQMDDFQKKTIKFCILPRIQKENVLLFLNEALKKIKVSENSNEIWSELLNSALSKVSENFHFHLKENPQDLIKINREILEEIIEEYVRLEKKITNTQMKEVLEFLCENVYKIDDIFTLLSIKNKNNNDRNEFSPNIIWEINKNQKTDNSGKIFLNRLFFALSYQFDNFNEKKKYFRLFINANENFRNSDKLNKCIHIYEENEPIFIKNPKKNVENMFNSDFLLHIRCKAILNEFEIIGKQNQTQIYNPNLQKEFLLTENLLPNKKSEASQHILKISIKIDFIYSLILTYISKNFEKPIIYSNFKRIPSEDLVAIIKNLIQNHKQDKIFCLLNSCKIKYFNFYI